jgi:GNAT superfamily N-acetyltransferase
MLELIAVTDDGGAVIAPDWLVRAEAVHRELRHQLPADYVLKMSRVFAGGGRMVVAARGESVCGVAVWTAYENTFSGVQMYVDDLVTDPAHRSSGVGHAVMEWLQAKALALGCEEFALDSGTQRRQAHKFYFREGMVVTSFRFGKTVVA